MRVVIAGDDEVALRIAEGLMQRHEVVVLFAGDGAMPTKLERLDVAVIQGSPSSRIVLEDAGIAQADYFIACTDYDEQNIVACLSAQRLGVRESICFITHPRLFGSASDGDLAEALGIDHVIRPPEQLSEEIVRIVTVPGALDVQPLLGGRVTLLKAEVEEGARITDGPLRSHSNLGEVVLVLGQRGPELFIPRGDTQFLPGDRVTVAGRWSSIGRFQNRYLRSVSRGREGHRAAVVGAGEVGIGVVRELEEAGYSVAVIESNRERCETAAELLHRSTSVAIHGDGSDLELLEEERIPEFPVLVAVTNNDEKNLLISLLAKHLGVERIITRANNLPNERLFEKVGIDVVLSAKGAAVRTVLRQIEGQSDHVAELEHGDVRVMEIEVDGDQTGLRLANLSSPVFAVVGAVQRQGRVIIPKGSTEIRSGDRLLVFTRASEESKCRAFFANPRGFRRRESGEE
jgi:trk system potassium uptake protein TrkA